MLLLSRLESAGAIFSLRVRPSGVCQEFLIDVRVVTFGIYVCGRFLTYYIASIQEILIDALVEIEIFGANVHVFGCHFHEIDVIFMRSTHLRQMKIVVECFGVGE